MATLFKRVRVYDVDKRTRRAIYLGDITLYLPQANHTSIPSSGSLVTNGVVTALWDSLMSWCASITLSTTIGIRSNSTLNPDILNYFTGITELISSAGYRVPAFENPENGAFVIATLSGNQQAGWINKARFESGATQDFNFPGFWACSILSNGNGEAYLPYYDVLDESGENPIFSDLGYIKIEWSQAGLPIAVNLTSDRSYNTSSSDINGLNTFWGTLTPVTPPDTDPYADIDGQGALPGDAVGLPDEPSLSALDAGMFALFSPTSAQMKSLASYLWTDFGGAGTDVVQMLGEVVEALKRTVANPLDLVLGLSIVASQGLSKGSASNVHVGFWDTGVAMTRLSKQYFSVDCGSVSFFPVCGDTFLDYAPYSKFSIFLPYVGMKTLDANDVVGHSIGVKYRGDCVTGGLACYLLRDGAIIAEYSGSCALNLPLSSENWGATISSAIAIAAGGAAGAIAGGGAGAAAGAIKGAASVASNPSVLSPQIQYNGAVAGGAGHMASQKPFILREVVSFHSTSHFNTVTGYPSYYYKQLGDCSGFTQVLDVHLFGLTATADEVAEIERLLKEGVIL